SRPACRAHRTLYRPALAFLSGNRHNARGSDPGVRWLDRRASPVDHRSTRFDDPDCILALPSRLLGVAAPSTTCSIRPIAASISTRGYGDLRAPYRGESSHFRFRVPGRLTLGKMGLGDDRSPRAPSAR